MKRIYLSGPMSNMPDFNFPAFNAEADRLRALGYDVVNPVDINPDTTTPYNECLRNDLKALLDCDTIAMLEGWMNSNGAHLEMNVAHRVGINIVEARDIQQPAVRDDDVIDAEWLSKSFDLVAHLYRQREFSAQTFGPGSRAEMVIAHIRKELIEIEGAPYDVEEWIDVAMLALDGAWRAGHSPETIAFALADKLARNEKRQWPDWRTVHPDTAIEHVRDGVTA